MTSCIETISVRIMSVPAVYTDPSHQVLLIAADRRSNLACNSRADQTEADRGSNLACILRADQTEAFIRDGVRVQG